MEAVKREVATQNVRVGLLLKLFWHYESGTGTEKKPEVANEYLSKVVQFAEADAGGAYQLALSYQEGDLGLEKNKEKALYWYKHAVELGHPLAAYAMKDLLYQD
ncbi:MAG: hypothetical protein AAGI49_08305 [Bacteroidota bacterium]